MQAITCPACGHDVQISPDAASCPQCGEDLHHLLDPVVDSRYAYQRASELAAAGDLEAALIEAWRGLAASDSPDLHLLAAILTWRLGRNEEMRTHIAAIPVDDSLRAEAEWLLRSQQRGDAAGASPLSEPENDFSLEEFVAPPPQPAPEPRRKPRRWPVAFVVFLLIAGGIVWLATAGVFSPGSPDPGLGAGEADSRSLAATGGGAPLLPTPTPTLTPTPLPTATVSPNLVSAPTADAELAAVDASVVVSDDAAFDLAAYLTTAGHDDLAELDVSARFQGAELTLVGAAPFAIQRSRLIELLQEAPGVDAVNAAELYVRPPVTYTVQSGDSLWSITARVYGDAAYMEEIYNANRDAMTSPSALRTGMVLKLPPIK
jgi:LysM repeat protein